MEDLPEVHLLHTKQYGSPGVDGIAVDELAGYLRVHWLEIKVALLKG